VAGDAPAYAGQPIDAESVLIIVPVTAGTHSQLLNWHVRAQSGIECIVSVYCTHETALPTKLSIKLDLKLTLSQLQLT
jgi:hypothetical protein